MKRVAAYARPGRWLSRTGLLAFFSAASLGLAACSLSGPPPVEYVLGTTPAATTATIPQTGLPVIEVKRVQLPDYLDRTDLLERSGGQVVPSPTGRWGERLSVGFTRTLTTSLAARLRTTVVTATPPVERPARQVLVDVATFEPRADRQVVLVARWSITDGASRETLISEQTSLVEPVTGAGDDAVVAAMTHAVEDLAGQVAAGIERALQDRADRHPCACS